MIRKRCPDCGASLVLVGPECWAYCPVCGWSEKYEGESKRPSVRARAR